jgi:predicted phage terminase large subunit-like protein
MTLIEWETAARQFEMQLQRHADTPGELAQKIDPNTINTPALQAIDQALLDVINTSDGRLIITMPPQEGKSTRVAKDFPIWLLSNRPELRIVTASYNQGLANRNGRAIRDTITANPDLDMKIAADNGAAREWQLSGHRGGVLSVGIGAGLTGRPADVLIIDDPIKDRKEADSLTFRDSRWDWWTDVGSTRLAPGAPVIVILTRWHTDDLAGRLLAAADGHIWRVLNIPAQADHRPEKGETDVLGRQPGEYMTSARRDDRTKQPRTKAQWEAIKVRSGSRTWASLYQGSPTRQSGAILKRAKWKYYDQPLWVVRDDGSHVVPDCDEMLQSWDFTFTDTEASDFVVGQVWMRRGPNAYLLYQVRRRMDFVESTRAMKDMTAVWPQALLKLVENKANGPAIIASLRATMSGIVPEEPQGSKSARASAISPFQEAGNLWIPDPALAPWVGGFVDECADFPNSPNDDQVDATSQAVNRLLVQPLLPQDEQLSDDDVDDDDGYGISQY